MMRVRQKGLPWIHEAGTPNGIGAVTTARTHKFLFEEIGEEKLEEHTRKLLEVIKNVTPMLREAGYNVYFSEDDKMRTPILIVDNAKKSNKQTVEELNRPCGEYDKNVFVREGIFCAYRVMEILRPELKNEPKVVNGKLNEGYSLIRLSTGFINAPEDIWYAAEKLAKINQN